MKDGYIRVAAASFDTSIADIKKTVYKFVN